jgi:N6-L-threonylcarbamoyladenine synthase
VKGSPFDFSFSGIKTAVLYHLRAHPGLAPGIELRKQAQSRGARTANQLRPLCDAETLDLIASFQSAVVENLVGRTLAAAKEIAARSVLISGGVAANSWLRKRFEEEAASRSLEVFLPSRILSTDNAAMIAAAAYPKLRAGDLADGQLNAEPGLRLG